MIRKSWHGISSQPCCDIVNRHGGTARCLALLTWFGIKIVAVYLVAINLFEPKSNLDYIIAGLVSALAFIGAGVLIRPLAKWLWAVISTPWAFKMEFTEPHFNPPFTKKQKIVNRGRSEIWLRVGPRTPTIFNDYDLRFVTKGGSMWRPKYEKVSKETVCIETAQHQEDAPSPEMPVTKNREGGVNIKIKEPFSRSNDEYFWLRIKMSAQGEWEGLISFRSKTASGRRSCKRLPVKVG